MSDREMMIKELKKYFKEEFYRQLERLSDVSIAELFRVLNGRWLFTMKKKIRRISTIWKMDGGGIAVLNQLFYMEIPN